MHENKRAVHAGRKGAADSGRTGGAGCTLYHMGTYCYKQLYIMYTWYIQLGGHVLEDYEAAFKVAAVSGSAA